MSEDEDSDRSPASGDGQELRKSRQSTEASKEGWTFLSHVKLNDLYMVTKYRCNKTKMDLIHAHVPGPHVHCYCVIPHKLEDDLGLPHILQHVIFQGGSKVYPQPHLIHRIVGRSFSSGLKSWVERDHSCYHFTTAGKVGCEQILPVFFDHILQPLLKEASFLQEVYHVDGDGNDYGNCLDEMIKMEWDPEVLTTLELIKTIFGPESGYRFNYAGSSNLLRTEELKLVDKLKEFHEKFYHLANCCLFVSGDISKQDLFPIINKITDSSRSSRKKAKSWEKPWLSEPLIGTLTASLTSRLEYPCNDCGPGVHVKVGIVGPPSTEKLNRCVATRLALEYLVKGPLFSALDESKTRRSMLKYSYGEDVPANTYLSVSEYELNQTIYCIDCHNVPKDMASAVPHIFRRSAENHLNSDDDFDYVRMVQVVQRYYNQEMSGLENKVEEKICRNMIPDYLYAEKDSDLMFDRRVNSAYTIHHFLNQPPEFWKHVIQMCILEANWVTITATPSSKLADELAEADINRKTQRMEPEHIKDTKRIAQRYKASMKLLASQQNTEGEDVLENFPLPPVESIGYTWISRQENPRWADETLCNLYVDDVYSNYVFLTVIMDTTELTLEEKKYLVLFADSILNSPFIDSSDQFYTAEEMEEHLQRDCLSYETFFGLEWLGRLEDRTKFTCGSFPHLFCLRLQLDATKMKQGFYWAQNILWNTKWQADRLKSSCQKLVLEVDEELKKLGAVMTRAMLIDSLYLMNSTPKAASLIRQKMLLRKIGDDLPKSMRRVSKMLEGIRMTLLRPENCTVHVAGSLSKMEFNLTEDPNARDAIPQLFKSTFDYTGWHWGYDTKRLSNAFDMNVMKSLECIVRCSREQILRMEDADAGYLVQAVPALKSWQDSDYPMLLATLQYFIQLEGGPLHTEIVEKGLAEEVDIRVSPSEGLIYFEMRRSQDIAQAYGKAFDIMSKHCSEDLGAFQEEEEYDDEEEEEETIKKPAVSVWKPRLLTSAKSSIIFRLTQEENTPQHVAMLSLLGYYKGIHQIGHVKRHLMSRIAETTLAQVSQMTAKYLGPLFLQPCTCAASVPKDKGIQTIQNLMERCGKRLTLIPPVEHSAMASYNQ